MDKYVVLISIKSGGAFVKVEAFVNNINQTLTMRYAHPVIERKLKAIEALDNYVE